MVDWYEDQFRPKADRKLTLEEARELSSHWEPIDSDPITFDEIEESIPPPDWPDWQERHFRRVQWMLYLLRLAHVNRGLTVPGERLHETGLIKDDVEFRSRELGIISGYDAWMKIMRNLQDNGAVSELANIWAKMNPPKEGAAEGTPCSWHIVVDHYINLPLPDWYLQEMTKVNEELDAANEEEEQDEDEPLDDWGDLFSNVELPKGGFEELEEMADYRNDIALMVKEAEKRRWQEERVAAEEAKQKRRGAEEARGGSPPGSTSDRDREGGESGPFWMEDGAGEAYLSGDVLTLNCTIMYEIDIEAGQIWRMKFGWAAALGNIKSAEDALMLFRKAAGSEHEGEGRDYSDWGHLRVNV
eukprot:evm.model.scf_139.8 EVM.evm.TU.scf_139.8   scf_139:83627-86697(+)